MRALIIGGGIGGLSVALALKKIGVEVQVFERAAAIREVGAAIAVWPNALKLCDKLGLGAAVRARGGPMGGGAVRTAHGKILARISMPELEKRCGAATVFIHRADFIEVLYQAVGAEQIRLNSACTHFEQTAGGVSVHFAEGYCASGDFLVGADGLKSAIRMQLFPHAKPVYAGYTAWRGVANFEYPPEADWWGESWGRGVRVGFLPLCRQRAAWWATDNAPENRPAAPAGHQQEVLRLLQGWHAPLARVIQATPESAILRNDIYALAPLPRWVEKRVALLGDAAHAMTPNLGQGACMALEDGFVLARSLEQQGAGIENGLREYERQRMPRANEALRESEFFGKIGQWSNPLACWIRDRSTSFTPSNIMLNKLLKYAGTEA
jgi:2-polyprenyl-6-methoxyphenol hydroxylase-like FAD-dependent oxidoreductase